MSTLAHTPSLAGLSGHDQLLPLLPVAGEDLTVPLVQGGRVRYVNLDYAASAPALLSVLERLQTIVPYYASVHRGAGYTSQISTSVYESARNIVRTQLGGRPDDAVVFTRHTTDALNLLARCLPEATADRPGDVLYLDLEHHANLLPWQALPHRSVLAAPSVAATLELVERELRAGQVTLLAVTAASNVTGELLPVAELARLAHAHGARIVVDAAQLIPHRIVNIADWDVDYLAFSGHKIYAPFGAGVLIGRPDWLDQGPPHLAGGGAVNEVRPDSVRWASSPARHEGGSPNVLGAAALAAALEALAGLDQDVRQYHDTALREQLVAGLSAIDGVRVHHFFSETDPTDAVGIVNFSIAGYDAGLAAAYLSAEHGIGVRDGRFCAHPLLRRLGLPSGSLRASLGLGSRGEDIERLVRGVRELLGPGPQWDYVIDADRWVPVHDPRSFPAWAPNLPGTAGAAPCNTL